MFTSSSLCHKNRFAFLYIIIFYKLLHVLYWTKSTTGRSGTTQQFVAVETADILYCDWTACQRLIWLKPVPKNRTVAVIGSNQETNVVHMRAAVCWWGVLPGDAKTPARETRFISTKDRLTNKIRNCFVFFCPGYTFMKQRAKTNLPEIFVPNKPK